MFSLANSAIITTKENNMTTGIYQLNFKQSAFYIGQSLDIDARWKQHAEKLKKGTAAQKMQQAYDTYGMPDGIVLLECHKDYLDTMENYLIYKQKQLPGCLNTTAPKLDESINYQWMLENSQMLKFSAFDIMSQHVNLQHDHNDLERKYQLQTANFNKQYLLSKAAIELRDGKDENERLVKMYHDMLEAAQQRIYKLINRGILQRLFNYD